MKKILIIHPSLGLGGAEKIIAFLANALSVCYDVELMALKPIDKTLPLDDRVSVCERPVYSDKPIVGKHMLSGLAGLYKMSAAIAYETRRFSPHGIICFDLRVLLALSMARLDSNIRLIFSERADPYENPKYWAILLRRIYPKLDKIVFQTEAAREFYGDAVKGRYSIIPNPALSRTASGEVRDEACVKKYIFAAGRCQRRKGFDLLVDAFEKVADKYPEYKLLIFGSGQGREELEAQIAALACAPQISIASPVNGVVEKNINARLFVLPSRSEGIPNILIEAMQAGIPSVAADCSPGGARMLSDDGKFCLLAQNDNADSLAQCIDYALSHETEMTLMAKAAQESMTRFDKDAIANEWRCVVASTLADVE